MVKLSSLTIHKGIYRFEARKRFSYILRYRIINKPPLEKIKEKIKSFLMPKKEEKIVSATKTAPPGGFNLPLIVGAVAIAMIILLAGLFWWQLNLIQPTPAPFKPVEKSFFSNKVIETNVLTAGSRGTSDHVSAAFVEYESAGLANYSINIKTYPDSLPSEFFILNTGRVEASVYSEFLHELRLRLSKKGILLNEMSLDQLETVPNGAAIIIPSGVVPQELLIGPGNISRLLNSEVVVIYIGQSFKTMLDGSIQKPIPSEVKSTIPVSFNDFSTTSCSNEISLFQPLYSVGSSGGFSSFSIYGCIPVVKKGSGAFIFVPQTLDGGWQSDGKLAAADISKIILDTPFAVPDSSTGSTYFLSLDENTQEIGGRQIFFSNTYAGTSRSMKIQFSAYSTTGMLLEDQLIAPAKKMPLGELYVSQLSVSSTDITGEKIRMNAELKETTASTPLMSIVFTNSTGGEVERITQFNVNTQSSANFDVPISFDEGEYFVTLEDGSNNVYASTYLNIESVSISGPRFGAKPSIYVFDVSTPITLSALDLKLDNGAFTKTYSNVGAGPLSVDVTEYTGGDALSYGNHSFEFSAGQFTKIVSYNRPLPPPPFPPEMLFILLFAGLIVGIGVYFARQETVYLSLDIPDFPPVSRTKIPLATESVLALFEKVNENYRWEYTPLTVSEVKNGFGELHHQGRPIYITDYNAEFLLNGLKRREKLGEFMDYYGLLSWEKKSGHTIRYLGMLRKLRDICINNAIPFTSLEESPVCDSEITVVGQQMYLHFYGKEREKEIVKSSLHTLEKGITIVLFKDNSEKQDFNTLLNSPTNSSLLMKVEVENSSVLLLTYPELENMIQEFKGV